MLKDNDVSACTAQEPGIGLFPWDVITVVQHSALSGRHLKWARVCKVPLEFWLLGEDSVAPGIQWTGFCLFVCFFPDLSQFWRCLLLQWNIVSLKAILNLAALFVQPWAAFLPFFAWALLLKALLIPATLQRCLWELMWPISWPLTNTQNQELCWNSGSSKTRKTILISSQYSSRAPKILCAYTVGWVWLSLTWYIHVHRQVSGMIFVC